MTLSILVGQIGNLRPIGNRPIRRCFIIDGPITNRPQVTNLPHISYLRNRTK